MHPVVRIICLLVYITSLSRANAGQLIFAFLILVPLYLIQPEGLSKALKMLLRLRWFFISIILVYVWLTPTIEFTELSRHSSFWNNYWPGFIAGIERMFSLILIVFAVAHLLSGLTQEQLLAAIYWLAFPLVLLGVKRERLAIRMLLTLDLVQQSGQLDENDKENINNSTLNKWNYWAEKIVVRYQMVLQKADSLVSQEYSFNQLPSPDLIQWFYPVLLYLAFILASHLNIA